MAIKFNNDSSKSPSKPRGEPARKAIPKNEKKVTHKSLKNSNSLWSKVENFIGGLLPKPVKIEIESKAVDDTKSRKSTRELKEQEGLGSFNLKSSGSRTVPTSQIKRPANQNPNGAGGGGGGGGKPQPTGGTTPLPQQPKKLASRQMTYTRPVKYQEKTRKAKMVEVEEISNSRVLSKKPVLETVRNINDVKFFDRISLVSYYMAKNSGKLDEKASREEHLRNTQKMKRIYTLTNFIYDSSIRNLEYAGHESFILQVDSKFRDILDEVLKSKLLSSFDISIYYENKVLTKMNAEPVLLEVKLKKI